MHSRQTESLMSTPTRGLHNALPTVPSPQPLLALPQNLPTLNRAKEATAARTQNTPAQLTFTSATAQRYMLQYWIAVGSTTWRKLCHPLASNRTALPRSSPPSSAWPSTPPAATSSRAVAPVRHAPLIIAHPHLYISTSTNGALPQLHSPP